MSKLTRLQYAALNQMITGRKFKDPDEWLYSSLSQPPIKVIDKKGSDDELDWTVECPNCGAHKNYGQQIFMNSGRIYCDADGCREKLMKKQEGK
jgi:hypothetical protein